MSIRPIRLRLSRAKGFDLQLMSRAANGLPARSVARPGPFGNPWLCSKPYGCPRSPTYDHGFDEDGTPSMTCCVDTYREWIRQGEAGEESEQRRNPQHDREEVDELPDEPARGRLPSRARQRIGAVRGEPLGRPGRAQALRCTRQ